MLISTAGKRDLFDGYTFETICTGGFLNQVWNKQVPGFQIFNFYR